MVDAMKARDIVLVVDDSPETLSFLTDALEQSGRMVLVATGGVQALALVEDITPDIILMDAVMPGMDGFETCRRLKATGTVAHVPVIFMTGLSETEHVVQGFGAGGVDYVTKPIVLDELFARIRVHLANARSAQSARVALDSAGRFLFAASRRGAILWSTPQAVRLLEALLPDDEEGRVLPERLAPWLAALAGGAAQTMTTTLALDDGTVLTLSFVGSAGEDELLFRLSRGEEKDEAEVLRRQFQLTPREADVLIWVARGKSNRDIGEILGLSPRTVNKHLETIYQKLGVENRASAAVAVLKVLGER